MDFAPRQRDALLDVVRAVIRRELTRAGCDRDRGEDGPAAQDTGEDSGENSGEDPALLQPAGCFVSLHELVSHRLRGCVGRLDATAPLLTALRLTARSVLSDPRFSRTPVELCDLPRLQVELSVISPLTDVADCLCFEPV